jgi:tRNA-2-methylthio-N6-dimethylallyladenosine synthase
LDDLDNQHTDNSINHHVDQTRKKTINKKNQTPDILLLNTCTIRDHAEQKVYDALGPYAAMKRAGKPLAIVVAGCVAQQEGKSARIILIALYPSNRYLIKLISQSNDVLLFLLGEALLRRFPEIDLVLGPQYIPWLSDLLIEVGKGSQLCMTESMLWSESGGAAETKGKGWNSSREKDGDWMVPIKRGHSVRGWVNVIYGCNE